MGKKFTIILIKATLNFGITDLRLFFIFIHLE